MPEELESHMPTQEKAGKEIAHANFSRWNEALRGKDPKEVARLYAEDATFLPTMSDKLKKGEKGAEEYFKHFLEKNPTGEIMKDEVQNLGPDCYVHSGMYNFEVGPGNNRQMVEARFSFVWKKNQRGEWKIVHHHSSVKPKA